MNRGNRFGRLACIGTLTKAVNCVEAGNIDRKNWHEDVRSQSWRSFYFRRYEYSFCDVSSENRLMAFPIDIIAFPFTCFPGRKNS